MSEREVQAILVRALKTFVQAFLAVLAANAVNVVNYSTAKALVVSAFAAGISALINAFIKPQEAK